MGHAPTNATVKAVHAVLLRVTCSERVGDADKPVSAKSVGAYVWLKPRRGAERWASAGALLGFSFYSTKEATDITRKHIVRRHGHTRE